jgi:hypothetical protein
MMIIYSKKKQVQWKKNLHLDVSWLEIDEEVVPDDNTSCESKAKSRETKHSADYAHLRLLAKTLKVMPAFNQKLKN